jgi:methionyl-tRNA formyltransferase
MNERMDAGDVLLQERVGIAPEETAGALNARLAEIGAELMLTALAQIRDGTAQYRRQDDSAATFAPALRKQDGLVPWGYDAERIRNFVRAMTPWPGAFTFHRARAGRPARLILLRVRAHEDAAHTADPGTVLKADGAGLIVAVGKGTVELLEVKPAGGRAMNGPAFVRGHRVAVGDRFGPEQ